MEAVKICCHVQGRFAGNHGFGGVDYDDDGGDYDDDDDDDDDGDDDGGGDGDENDDIEKFRQDF